MTASAQRIERELLQGGVVRLSAGGASFTYQRLQPGTLLMTITGDDTGQFGSATIDEAAMELTRSSRPLTLFVDASAAGSPSRKVMEEWTAWFADHRKQLSRVVILVEPESKVLHLTVSIVKHLAGLGEVLRICGDRAEFEAETAKAAAR